MRAEMPFTKRLSSWVTGVAGTSPATRKFFVFSFHMGIIPNQNRVF